MTNIGRCPKCLWFITDPYPGKPHCDSCTLALTNQYLARIQLVAEGK